MSDLRGSTLSRPRKFLEAFARLDRPSEESWVILERIFDFRNVMVHESGFAAGYRNYKKMVEFGAVAPGLTFSNGHVEVKREFCAYCLDSISDFCDELHEAYESFRETAHTLHKLETR